MNVYGMIGIAYAVGFAFFGFCFWLFMHEQRTVKVKRKNKGHLRRDTNVETF